MHNRIRETSTLIDRYGSIIEIVRDPQGKALAYAMDMHYVDWLNFEIKNFIIRKRFMNQVVQVNIDGELVSLMHPDTQLPLLYRDFITDRSGPKFGGYLNENPGTEYLEGNVTRAETEALMQLLAFNTIHYCENNELLALDHKTLNNTLSIFLKKHQSQRKLTDFDLTARETHTLELAVLAAVEQKLNPEEVQHLRALPKLAMSIGKTAWQVGGKIHISLIRSYLEAKEPLELTYRQAVYNTMTLPLDHYTTACYEEFAHPEHAFTHMLIDGVGKVIRKEYLSFYEYLEMKTPPIFYQKFSSGVPDTFYGVGVPFYEASIEDVDERGNVKLSTKHEVIEIGDIICDNSSIFGKVFNAKNNFNLACKQLKKLGVTDRTIALTIESVKKTGMSQTEVYEKTLIRLTLKEGLPTQKEEREKILQDYWLRHDFIESSLMAEESGKKEAQSQLYKRENNLGKLIGNVSDTGCFALGITKASEHYENAKAHLDILKLTTLISVIRWGIDDTNHKQVLDTHTQLTSEQFMKSLNQRSYEGQPSSGIREALQLNHISRTEASKRLADYQRGFRPVWKTIQQNEQFFKLVHQYRQAKMALAKENTKTYGIALNQFGKAHANLYKHLKQIINIQMPTLAEKIILFSSNAIEKEEVMVSMMDQLEEAIAFGIERELKIKQKNAADNASFTEQPFCFFKFNRAAKISGPKMYEEIKKVQAKHGNHAALQTAKDFLLWKKIHHKNVNVKEIKKLVKELEVMDEKAYAYRTF